VPPTRQVRLILRLLAEPAARRQLVGQVEVVETGEVIVVHSAADIEALASRLARAPDP
jgi:hypothetical protein